MKNKVIEENLINYARGIAVFFMLWGHCIQCCSLNQFDFFENYVFKFIYSFHMPLFMLLSGYCFYFSFIKRNMKELLIHKTQKLLQPIIMCTILRYFMVSVIKGLLNGNISVLFGGQYLNDLKGIWFLWSVLSASISVTIIGKIVKDEFLSNMLLFFGIFIVSLFPCTVSNIFLYPYFILGFLLNKYKKNISNILTLIIPIIFFVMLFFNTKDCNINVTGLIGNKGISSQMPINLFRWAIGLFGSFTIIIFVSIGTRIKIFNNAFGNIIYFLGKKSLQVYVLSLIFLSNYLPIIHEKMVFLFGKDIFYNNMIIYNFVFTPIIAIIYSLAILFIVKIIEKYKINNILFGR